MIRLENSSLMKKKKGDFERLYIHPFLCLQLRSFCVLTIPYPPCRVSTPHTRDWSPTDTSLDPRRRVIDTPKRHEVQEVDITPRLLSWRPSRHHSQINYSVLHISRHGLDVIPEKGRFSSRRAGVSPKCVGEGWTEESLTKEVG